MDNIFGMPPEFSSKSAIDQLQQSLLEDRATWSKRPDGSQKGLGFFGMLPIGDSGSVATEYSIGVNINGKEIDIPSLVPILSEEEVQQVLDSAYNNELLPDNIIEKAANFAKERIKAGLPVFALPEEEGAFTPSKVNK